MFVQILFLFLSHLFLPAYFTYALWQGKEESKLQWLLKSLYSGAYVLYIFMAGSWAWLSIYLRYLLLGIFVVAVVVSYRRHSHLSFTHPHQRRWWQGNLVLFLEAFVFLALLGYVLTGYFYRGTPVELAFPLQDGRYYVGQGGGNPLLNYHNVIQSQRYALDVLALNTVGTKARGFYPSELQRYEIFGQGVHSPCDGVVVSVVDGLPDLTPPMMDADNPPGNHVIITCHNINIVLAHLQNGSVVVEPGTTVKTGELLGRVGNSGNTSEPHLHIHAVPAAEARAEINIGEVDMGAGAGVPLLFDGKFLTRNSTLRVGE